MSIEMRLQKFYGIIAVVLFLLSACSSSSESSELLQETYPSLESSKEFSFSEDLSDANIKQTVMIDQLQFPETIGYLYPGYNSDLAWWSELYFFGVVKGAFDGFTNDDIAEKLDTFFNADAVKTVNGDTLDVTTTRWIVSGDKNDEREIRLIVQCKNALTEPVAITSVIVTRSQITDELNVGNYMITPIEYTASKNGFVFENIFDLLDTAEKDMVTTFRIAIPQKHQEDDLSFSVLISDNPDIVSASVIGWEYDEATTEDTKQYYQNIKTPQELENFKIYAVDVRIITNTNDAVVVQPCFTIRYGEMTVNCKTEPFGYQVPS